MLQQLLHHIQKNNLIQSGEKVLLAVSGGIDSMVMLDLFSRTGIPFGVAHCNFKLRGQESDGDEQFVRDFCQRSNLLFHLERFDTERHATKNGSSIQIAARDLRYEFFRRVALSGGYHVVATAHHQDDNIETILLNLVRGTGIDGLTGIPVRNDIIIRPILFATRDEILKYALELNLQWREDSSNAEVHYKRNLLRLHVVPLLKQINPHFEETFRDTLQRISGAKELVDHAAKEFSAKHIQRTDEKIFIPVNALAGYDHGEVLLWTIIKEFGFNFDQCKQALEAHQSGKLFFSATHRLLIDREHLVLETIRPVTFGEVSIENAEVPARSGESVLYFEVCDVSQVMMTRDKNIAHVDLAKVKFPLTWRKWKPGDTFYPLGMTNKKKVSDLLIDEKVPLFYKENITVLESEGRIAWVVGVRISEMFKIDGNTRLVLTIKAGASDT